MVNFKKLATSPSRYTLKEGRRHGKINNSKRVEAAAAVLAGNSVAVVADFHKVSPCSVRNWIKTLAKNNPHLV